MSSPRRLTALRTLFWAAVLLAFVGAILPSPPQVPGAPNDKVQHIIVFLILGALAWLAYPRTHPVILGAALSAFGALIEVVQLIPSLHRDGDPIDWVADTAAAAFVLIFLHWLRVSRSGRASSKG